MEHDLTGVLSLPSISFTPANLKSLTHQMIAGLEYLHRIGILHRDMKGSNILLTAEGDLKLADFGLARLYNRKRKADYTNRVITLWYRSPELLMGETMYGPEVDMWSAGYASHFTIEVDSADGQGVSCSRCISRNRYYKATTRSTNWKSSTV